MKYEPCFGIFLVQCVQELLIQLASSDACVVVIIEPNVCALCELVDGIISFSVDEIVVITGDEVAGDICHGFDMVHAKNGCFCLKGKAERCVGSFVVVRIPEE